MPIGAPIRVPVSSGAIVVLQSLAPATTGSAVFTYQVVGDYYRWYEQPFIGLQMWIYYLFLIAVGIAICFSLYLGVSSIPFSIFCTVATICGGCGLLCCRTCNWLIK